MSFDFRWRLVGLREKMEAAGLDLVVYGSCQNFQYLTGLLIDWRHGTDLGSGSNNVFVPREGEPILTVDEEWAKQAAETWIKDVRVLTTEDSFEKQLGKVLRDLCLDGKKVGLGDHVWGSTVTEIVAALKNPVLQKAKHLLDDTRMIKDSGEIERLRKVEAHR